MPSKDQTQSSPSDTEKYVLVEKINVPGRTTRVIARMYHAMRQAMPKVLPSEEPGLTQTETREAVIPHLLEDLFPGDTKAGWWAKTVQLDLEAKGIIVRETAKPLRWH